MFARRSLHTFALLFLASVAACTAQDASEDGASSESALLPNATIFDVGHDGSTYRLIAEHYKGRLLDLHVDTTAFTPAWPLTDTKTTVLNRVGTPILYSAFGYYHTGFDVMRSESTLSGDVLAPHDGLALVFDWNGNRIAAGGTALVTGYTTIVAIYDPTSHVITQMMHVAATPALLAAADPITVTKGEVIGKLAPAPVPTDSSRLAHVQMDFIDGENMTILNPATLYGAAYHDAVAPDAKSLYIADETAKVQSSLVSGKIDLVLEAADRDDDSARNLEISAVAFNVQDQAGAVLLDQPRCNLDHLYDTLSATPGAAFRATQLVDFESAKNQVGGAWPLSDVDNANRTFRYGITNLAIENGRCIVKDDGQSFLTIADATTSINVTVTLWDPKGNQSTKSFTLTRSGATPPPVLPPPVVDPFDPDL